MPVRSVPAVTGFAEKYARAAAGDPVPLAAVLEVTRNVEMPVASTWLNELDQRFYVSGRELVELADAGMPPSLIDQMVAMSYPAQFAVRRNVAEARPPGRRWVRTGRREAWGPPVGTATAGIADTATRCWRGATTATAAIPATTDTARTVTATTATAGTATDVWLRPLPRWVLLRGQQPIIVVPRDTDDAAETRARR